MEECSNGLLVNMKNFLKKYWYLVVVFAILIYLAYPKYSGESSKCTGDVECKCFGLSYTTWSGPDAPYIKHCIGIVNSCKKISEGNIIYCP